MGARVVRVGVFFVSYVSISDAMCINTSVDMARRFFLDRQKFLKISTFWQSLFFVSRIHPSHNLPSSFLYPESLERIIVSFAIAATAAPGPFMGSRFPDSVAWLGSEYVRRCSRYCSLAALAFSPCQLHFSHPCSRPLFTRHGARASAWHQVIRDVLEVGLDPDGAELGVES